MKLTKEQIQQVEEYLKNKDVEYIDLHLEVLDHICTDIEKLISKKHIDFYAAFVEVKLKWTKTFSHKRSYLLGISNGGSKLFIDHCLKIYKPLFFKLILGVLLFLSLFYWFIRSNNLDLFVYKSSINYCYIIIAVIYTLFLFYWKFQIKQTTLKSVFSYLFNKQIFTTIYMGLYIFTESFNSQQEFKFSKFLLFTLFIAILILGFTFYRSHLKAVSNYKKYQLQ